MKSWLVPWLIMVAIGTALIAPPYSRKSTRNRLMPSVFFFTSLEWSRARQQQ